MCLQARGRGGGQQAAGAGIRPPCRSRQPLSTSSPWARAPVREVAVTVCVLLAAQSPAHRARREAGACTPEPGLSPPPPCPAAPAARPARPLLREGGSRKAGPLPSAVTCLHDEPRHSEVHPRLGCRPPLGTPRRAPHSATVQANGLHEAPPRGPGPPAGRKRGPSARPPAPGVLAAGAASRPAPPPRRPAPARAAPPPSSLPGVGGRRGGEGGGE